MLTEIRAMLKRDARKHGVYWLRVNQAMDGIDQAVGDMYFEVEEQFIARQSG